MREAVVRLIAEQRIAILALLGPVEGDAWDAPSPCEEWSLRDVLAHLVAGELAIGRIYRGEVAEQGFVDLTSIERWSALPAAAVRTSFWQHTEASGRILAGMDDARWRAPIKAFGCSRMSQLARLHLFEAVVHSYDMASALGLPAPWSDDARAFAVSFALRSAPAALARHGVEPAGSIGFVAGTVRARLTGRDGRWTLDAGGASDSQIVADEAEFLLAATGRGRLAAETISGDRVLAERVLAGLQVTR